jgi:hypothetical protein
MEIQLDSKIYSLVTSLEKDLNKAVHEALTLWLKERLLVCPITNQLCEFQLGQCNDCPVTKKQFSKER